MDFHKYKVLFIREVVEKVHKNWRVKVRQQRYLGISMEQCNLSRFVIKEKKLMPSWLEETISLDSEYVGKSLKKKTDPKTETLLMTCSCGYAAGVWREALH